MTVWWWFAVFAAVQGVVLLAAIYLTATGHDVHQDPERVVT